MLKLYRNLDGSYGKFIAAILLTVLRAVEVWCFVFLLSCLVLNFERHASGKDGWDFERVVWLIAAGNVITGLCYLPLSFASVSIYGWGAEEVMDRCKVAAMRRVLDQDAAYFDNPHNGNAKIIQRISIDSLAMKAVG